MRIVLLICFLSSFCLRAQLEYSTKEINPFVFYNYQRNRFTIIDDSIGCKEFNPIKKQWEQRKLKFKLEEPFANFLENYLVLHEKNSEIFFVDRGCGQVYILKNDSIYRHDHSFHHQNQFDGLFFIYNNEPHIFGGYGLFTSKNIITRYDLRDKEWYHYDIEGSSPTTRRQALGKIINNKLYITGGFYTRKDKNFNFYDCWVFNFKTQHWKYLGDAKKTTFPKINSEITKQSFSNEYIVSPSFIHQFNFKENKINVFKNPFQAKLKEIIRVNNIDLLIKRSHDDDCFNFVIAENNSLTQITHFELFESQKDSNYFTYFVVLVVILILFFTTYRIYKKVTTKEYFFDEIELKLLSFFFQNENQGIEMSLINDIVNQDNPSIDTLKKRRENLVRELKSKISKECKIPVETVFLEEKSALDKRIKIMKLNPMVFKRYKVLFVVK